MRNNNGLVGSRAGKIVVWIVLGTFLVLTALYVLSRISGTSAVDGIPCVRSEGTALHIHSQLTILADGQNVVVPANIGIKSACLYWLHTHDDSGTVHIESPTQRDFTLGEFLDMWKQTQPGTYKFDQNTVTSVTVNGKTYADDYRSLVFVDDDKIIMTTKKI